MTGRSMNQGSRIIAALALLILAACGKKEPTGRGHGETPEYREWKGSQAVRSMAAPAGFAAKLQGTVTVHLPLARSKTPDDFVELYLNGLIVQRTVLATGRTGAQPSFTLNVTLMAGPDTFDLWDSTTNKYYRFQIDTRNGTDFVYTPSEGGYGLTWSKRE